METSLSIYLKYEDKMNNFLSFLGRRRLIHFVTVTESL